MNPLIINGELVLYGTVGDMWEIEFFTAADVIVALAQLAGDITVRLNSGGGDTAQGMAIYNALKAYPGKVTIVVDGIALSAASLIAMAGDRIVMNTGALMMVHEPSSITYGGNSDDHAAVADMLDKLAGQVAAIYAARAGISADEARALMKVETWFTADEAVAAGFADATAPATAASVSLFDFRTYRHSPASLTELATASATMFQPKAAPAAQPKETSMTLEELIAQLAARLNAPAGDVTTMCNQAVAIGLEVAAIATMFSPATSLAAAKELLKGRAATMIGGSAPVLAPAPTPAPTPTSTMSAEDLRAVAARAAQAGLDLTATTAIMALTSREAAFAAIIDRVADMRGSATPAATAQVTRDARDKFVEGAQLGLMARAGVEGGQRNEFSNLSLVDLARESLVMSGRAHADVRRMDRMLMIGTAFTTMAGGPLSTSDFAYILQNVAQKSALKGYQEADETFQLWTSVGQASDFKPIARVDLGLFPALDLVREGGEYKYAQLGDRGATIVIATYGKMIAITRQAIINDDLSILGSLPVKMGRAAKRTIGNLVYGVLDSNPTMGDGIALFHSDHGNLAGSGGAPSEATWQAATQAMGKQRDGDKNAIALNIRPTYFLSSAYEFTAKQLLQSTGSVDNQKSTGVINTVQGLVTPITDQRITGNAWYFAANPNQFDTIEVTYLDGVQEPVVESQDGWSIDGTELKVRIDAGVNPLDFRGFYKNPGP